MDNYFDVQEKSKNAINICFEMLIMCIIHWSVVESEIVNETGVTIDDDMTWDATVEEYSIQCSLRYVHIFKSSMMPVFRVNIVYTNCEALCTGNILFKKVFKEFIAVEWFVNVK